MKKEGRRYSFFKNIVLVRRLSLITFLISVFIFIGLLSNPNINANVISSSNVTLPFLGVIGLSFVFLFITLILSVSLDELVTDEDVKIMKKPEHKSHEIYWHAGITGRDDKVVSSIIQRGVLPAGMIGEHRNANTPSNDNAYVAQDARGALGYLKHASGYNYKFGGLPYVVAIQEGKLGKAHSYDTDVAVDDLSDEYQKKNNLAWFSFIRSYKSVKDFVNDSVADVSLSGQNIKKELRKENLDTISYNRVRDILNKGNYTFYQGQRLAKLKSNVNELVWENFLKIFNNIRGPGFHRNLAKQGGFSPEQIRGVYVITPGGDKDWQKWAKLMRPEDITKWQEWDKLTYEDETGTHHYPGKGKLVRVA
ncbi:MAG: hypothetical protein WCK90_03175 [archaeon]